MLAVEGRVGKTGEESFEFSEKRGAEVANKLALKASQSNRRASIGTNHVGCNMT